MSQANPRRTAVSLAVASAFAIMLQAAPASAQQLAMATTPNAVNPDVKVEAVIVTGTRVGGLKAIDSASPVVVLDSTSLERTGQPA